MSPHEAQDTHGLALPRARKADHRPFVDDKDVRAGARGLGAPPERAEQVAERVAERLAATGSESIPDTFLEDNRAEWPK